MPDVNENLLRRLKSLIDSGDPTLLSLLGQTKSNDGNDLAGGHHVDEERIHQPSGQTGTTSTEIERNAESDEDEDEDEDINDNGDSWDPLDAVDDAGSLGGALLTPVAQTAPSERATPRQTPDTPVCAAPGLRIDAHLTGRSTPSAPQPLLPTSLPSNSAASTRASPHTPSPRPLAQVRQTALPPPCSPEVQATFDKGHVIPRPPKPARTGSTNPHPVKRDDILVHCRLSLSEYNDHRSHARFILNKHAIISRFLPGVKKTFQNLDISTRGVLCEELAAKYAVHGRCEQSWSAVYIFSTLLYNFTDTATAASKRANRLQPADQGTSASTTQQPVLQQPQSISQPRARAPGPAIPSPQPTRSSAAGLTRTNANANVLQSVNLAALDEQYGRLASTSAGRSSSQTSSRNTPTQQESEDDPTPSPSARAKKTAARKPRSSTASKISPTTLPSTSTSGSLIKDALTNDAAKKRSKQTKRPASSDAPGTPGTLIGTTKRPEQRRSEALDGDATHTTGSQNKQHEQQAMARPDGNVESPVSQIDQAPRSTNSLHGAAVSSTETDVSSSRTRRVTKPTAKLAETLASQQTSKRRQDDRAAHKVARSSIVSLHLPPAAVATVAGSVDESVEGSVCASHEDSDSELEPSSTSQLSSASVD